MATSEQTAQAKAQARLYATDKKTIPKNIRRTWKEEGTLKAALKVYHDESRRLAKKSGTDPASKGTSAGAEAATPGIPDISKAEMALAGMVGMEGMAAQLAALKLQRAMAARLEARMPKLFKGATAAVGWLQGEMSDMQKGMLKASSAIDNVFGLSMSNLKDQLIATSRESAIFGVSLSENKKIMEHVAETSVGKLMPGFNKSFHTLSKNVTMWKALNVEQTTATGIMNTLQGTLGMTADQLVHTRRELSTFAHATHQSVQSVARDYQNNIKAFMDMLDPGRMNRAFMIFQTQAKRMNMEASRLFSIAEKFDTIDSANEIGGRLNQTFSAIGIEFNALALSEMSIEQRTGYISEKVNEAFKTIRRDFGAREGRLLMRSLAGGLGIDVSELRGLGAEGAGGGRGLAFEKQLQKGPVSVMSVEQEKLMAQQLASLKSQKDAMLELSKALLVLKVPEAMGDVFGTRLAAWFSVQAITDPKVQTAMETWLAKIVGKNAGNQIEALVDTALKSAFKKFGALKPDQPGVKEFTDGVTTIFGTAATRGVINALGSPKTAKDVITAIARALPPTGVPSTSNAVVPAAGG
jgi:hypothetical protein